MRLRSCFFTFFLCAIFVSSGCMMTCPPPSSERKTDCGEVKFLDYATCSRLKVREQECTRDDEGRLAVTVKWYNSADKDYEAQVRRIFWDPNGHKERGSFRWDLQTFRAREVTACTWKSYSDGAAMYRIEVRKAE